MGVGAAPLAFGALVAGAVIIDYGAKATKGALAANQAGGTGTAVTSSTGSGTPTKLGRFPAAVDPLPDSVGTSLDQGIDFTGKTFLSPWAGKVVLADAHNSGWAGGGFIAVQSNENTNMVYYVSEGVAPIVKVGDMVAAGQKLAFPVSNPYNGIVGNGEAGLANPASPGQPLAQVHPDPAGMVREFVNWLYALPGGAALKSAEASAGRLGHA